MENTIKQIVDLVTQDESYKLDYTNEVGANFLLPGHALYIYNEGSGWSFELRSDYTGVISEGYDYEDVFEMLEEELGIEA